MKQIKGTVKYISVFYLVIYLPNLNVFWYLVQTSKTIYAYNLLKMHNNLECLLIVPRFLLFVFVYIKLYIHSNQEEFAHNKEAAKTSSGSLVSFEYLLRIDENVNNYKFYWINFY